MIRHQTAENATINSTYSSWRQGGVVYSLVGRQRHVSTLTRYALSEYRPAVIPMQTMKVMVVEALPLLG
jgi:hypothetical protein